MTTRLQEAAYGAQWAAGLPGSELGRERLARSGALISVAQCAAFIEDVRTSAWFVAAYGARARAPLLLVTRDGTSTADRDTGVICIGTDDRRDPRLCEHACLHELAHLVTTDRTASGSTREPAHGDQSSHGHHHAWRANFVFIVRMTLGAPAAARLRDEFNAWDLPTLKHGVTHART